MILLLNGAFGIGKTTLARILVDRMPGAMLFDPELHGIAMQRAARLMGHRVEDFQDLPAWRGLTVVGLRIARRFTPRIVVPMAVSNPRYLTELREGISRFETDLVHACLVAPLEVVHARLRARGSDPASDAWAFRRAAECCVAHADGAFATHIDTERRTPQELADRILADYFVGPAPHAS